MVVETTFAAKSHKTVGDHHCVSFCSKSSPDRHPVPPLPLALNLRIPDDGCHDSCWRKSDKTVGYTILFLFATKAARTTVRSPFDFDLCHGFNYCSKFSRAG